MKKEISLAKMLFWLTLISPMISFSLACLIGEADIFGITGMIRYSWIMLLFIPIGILSILIGIKLKNNNQKYKKNFVISFICLPLLVIFGSYRFIFKDVISYDVNKISIVEAKTNITLPHEIKIGIEKFNNYDISYVKIVNNESKKIFEQEIASNKLWQNNLEFSIKTLLPYNLQFESNTFDYFVFYNVTSNEYNIGGEVADGCDIVFIAYDCDLQRLMILDNYIINLNNTSYYLIN